LIYGDDAAEIAIETGEILDGYLPAKALSLTREWLDIHRIELADMWRAQEFRSIPPLL
jgi:hypothetical protein